MGIGDREYMHSGHRFRGLSGLNPLWVIIGINVFVFILWQVAGPPKYVGQQAKNPELYRFMYKNFMTSMTHLESWNIWTLFTSMFSHIGFVHILFNMLIMYGFARVLIQRWGARRFVMFYLGAGVFSATFHPLLSLVGWPDPPVLGASGAVAGVVTCFALYYPKAKIHLWGILPMPAWFLVVALSGYDLYKLIDVRVAGAESQVAHGAHIGGAIAGVLYVMMIEKRLAYRGRRPRREKRPRGRVLRPDESSWQQPVAPPRRDPEDDLLDQLLEKVSSGGLDSLSIQERETLERISAKRRSGRR